MKGALVFLTVFVVFVVITLFVPSLPPGSYIYYSVGGVNVNYAIVGITVPRLVPAVLNGVIYGVIAWLIYEVYCWITEKNKKTQKA
jgi:prepilin signal peptidase PulO-like enzyme (type II secretory pathway)